MNSDEVLALVDSSLAGPRSVHVSHTADPDRYIADLSGRFSSARIRPELRTVLLEHERYGLNLPVGEHQVYFVCDSDPQSVFYDPKTKSFGCAWGPDASTQRYVDLGFRSQDVLEMLSA